MVLSHEYHAIEINVESHISGLLLFGIDPTKVVQVIAIYRPQNISIPKTNHIGIAVHTFWLELYVSNH